MTREERFEQLKKEIIGDSFILNSVRKTIVMILGSKKYYTEF